jgi:hypothetical protein
MTTLMPTKRTWVDPESGVEIEMITYHTILMERLKDTLAKYKEADGTMSDVLATFIICAGSTTDVRIPAENVPEWAKWLHTIVKDPMWLRDVGKTYESLTYGPSDMLVMWYAAYDQTRDKSHAAPAELQQEKPKKPLPDPETGEVDQTALNFTSESKPDGVKPLTIMSLPMSDNQPTGRQRKAK